MRSFSNQRKEHFSSSPKELKFRTASHQTLCKELRRCNTEWTRSKLRRSELSGKLEKIKLFYPMPTILLTWVALRKILVLNEWRLHTLIIHKLWSWDFTYTSRTRSSSIRPLEKLALTSGISSDFGVSLERKLCTSFSPYEECMSCGCLLLNFS